MKVRRRKAACRPPLGPFPTEPTVRMPQPQPTPPGYGDTSVHRYPWDGGSGEDADEAAVLLALAVAGGDLTAHRAVHAPQEPRRHS